MNATVILPPAENTAREVRRWRMRQMKHEERARLAAQPHDPRFNPIHIRLAPGVRKPL